jgi:hypothetical protein
VHDKTILYFSSTYSYVTGNCCIHACMYAETRENTVHLRNPVAVTVAGSVVCGFSGVLLLTYRHRDTVCSYLCKCYYVETY